MPPTSPTDINPTEADDRPRGSARDWLLTAGLAVVLSVPMVGAVRLLDGDSPSTPVPDASTPGATTTAGADTPAPAGQIVPAPAAAPLTLVGDRSASDAAVAMELGADAVLMNTAIASAQDPVRMARAMKLAVEAGWLARNAGRIQPKLYATASSPLQGLIA